MASIYEIKGEFLRFYQSVTENPESWEDEEFLNAVFEDLMNDFTHKADGYGQVMTNMRSDAEAIRTEANRLLEKARLLEKGADRLNERLDHAMTDLNINEIQGELFQFKYRKLAPQLPKDIDSHPELIPDKYWIPQPDRLDKKGLLNAVKKGEVDGITLHTGRSLQMK